MNLLQHIVYRATTARPSGLLPLPRDDRDYDVGIFGWFEYNPKYTRKLIDTVSVKDQNPLNTCGWVSSVAGKEPDEGVVLNEQSVIAYAAKNRLLSGNGFSNLRDNQKVLQQFGAVAGKPANPGMGWNSYINVDVAKLTPEASKHKTKTYWSVSSRGDILKLLDEGRTITAGMEWFTGFNQGGGFSSPWLITKPVGVTVGGHAVLIVGYDLNYHGYKVYIIQNSYGSKWGDAGKFYIEMSYLENQSRNYGMYTNLDIEKETVDIITQYAQQNVKGDKSNGVYHISMGKKRVYPSMAIMFSWGVKVQDIVTVPQADLDKVPEGNPMQAENSPHYPLYEELQPPIVTKLK